ncbi:uncharacterized protein M437DRAFT_62423 [Aureobasidium melanogenum CBS 110374]|uniref:Uncharacterized protein n=1 Tax=Aureobasidium melanogenum (strain CBS 110374) TaxID=1043003 RepID=A0A074WUZ8_AURM1|nr:uncharacterized protein M437DRAFT_62423 [Aureobasidium melanogenum CBS 110374]KEQ66196.1 hypothetical protein M437DRAFT_62423 [Aureobasidium melanogenum CBS 110374]
MKLPESMLLLEPLHCTAEEILQSGARNSTAVQNYLSYLEKGWLGQALIERYTYTQSPSTPAGMIRTNAIIDGKFIEWLKPIQDEIKDDLRDLLKGGYIEELVTERSIYAKAMEIYPDDPGRELLGQLVEMIDEGLQEMPKVYVIVKNKEGEAVGPLIEVKGSCGVEDAIAGLSQKVLDEGVVGMEIRKSGCRISSSFD